MDDKVYLIVEEFTTNDAHGSSKGSIIRGATLTIEEANDYINKQKIFNDDQGEYEVTCDEKKWSAYKGCYAKVDWFYILDYKDQTRVYNTMFWREVNRLDKEP